jgi:hypothetical protein
VLSTTASVPAAPLEIRPLAAVHLREALEAAAGCKAPAAVAALMHIDAASWQAISARLAQLGPDLPALLTDALTGGTP